MLRFSLQPQPRVSFMGHMLPLLIWLALQLAALAVSAMEVPLAEQFPRPAERAAIELMLIVQVVGAALLFPVLFRGPGISAALIAATWPFLQLAGILSSATQTSILLAAGYVTAWMLLLGVMRFVLRSNKLQLIGVALATLLSLGGPALWYLHAEFAAGIPLVDWRAQAMAGPVMGALSLLQPNPPTFLAFAPLLAGLCVCLTVMLAYVLRKRTNLAA